VIKPPIMWNSPAQVRSSAALFLDRDGVINVDYGYTHRAIDFRFVDGILDCIRHHRTLGYAIIVVTNQSGIARGYFSEDEFIELTDWMMRQMDSVGATVDAVYYCPHGPDDHCPCRKPKPGMIRQGLQDYSINPRTSYLIGDSIRDIEAATAANLAGSVHINPTTPLNAISFPKILSDDLPI